MLLRFEDIPPEGLTLDAELDPSSPSGEGLGPGFSVRGTFRVERRGPVVFIRGKVTGSLGLDCSRCLKAFSGAFSEQVTIELHPLSEVEKRGHEKELGQDALDVDFYREDVLDVDRLLADQARLAFPMKPLCSEECGGLCPVCGGNRNEKPCSCGEDRRDPRWDALQGLKKKEK